jgi:hypothetical protein
MAGPPCYLRAATATAPLITSPAIRLTPDDEIFGAPALTSGGANARGIARYLTVAGIIFVALMTTLEPDVGFAAPPAARILFWGLQVSTGLVVLQLVLYLLTRRYGASHVSSWVLVLVSGVLGAVVLAPVYWLIGEGLMEQWFGYPVIPDDEGDELIGLPLGNPLLQEYVDIVGPVTTAWLLICLPRLHRLVPPLLHRNVSPARMAQGSAAGSSEADPRVDLHADGRDYPAPDRPADSSQVVSTPITDPVSASPRPRWCERLPTEVGTDVIAVASELQYLRVWTPRGCALILGALADVEAESASDGLRVHRSWWVACKHVLSVRRSATGVVCVMSDGRHVPVSRRRRTEVLARFGDGVQYRRSAESEAVTQADLYR